ncbi:MAG: thermonuclease family protein [Anaerolineae bacterium]
MHTRQKLLISFLLLLWIASACQLVVGGGSSTDPGFNDNTTGGTVPEGESAVVTRIIDGDTIDVRIGDVGYRVRYVGVNTPESDEPCYSEATDANAALVEGQTVTLVQDVSNTDRYGRLLRFVYVGSTFVNAELVREGYAEAVLYDPDDGFHDEFVRLEEEATNAGRGCHPTGIFNDGSYTR